MGALISKLFTIAIWFFHSRLPSKQRWFLRMNLKCWIRQQRFIYQDYVAKKTYKIISFDGEFAPELKFVLPFAYWHHKNGTLGETRSSCDTKPFYYFSSAHYEDVQKRKWNDFKYDLDIPNSFDHGIKYDYRKWEKVPLKEKNQKSKISFDKPTLVISNKYNEEWGGPPINFISIDTLSILIENLTKKYQVVYNRPLPKDIVQDNSEVFDFPDIDLVRSYESVYYLGDLFESSKKSSFNQFQINLYAGCERFISVQGGNSVLASYFGGDNIIYAKRGLEIEMNEYQTIFTKLSDARIHHVDSYDRLIKKVDELYF